MKQILVAGHRENTKNYTEAFARLGVQAITLDTPNLCLSSIDGLLLPGGGDIAPELFGEENRGSHNIDKSLDQTQLKLLTAFVQAEKPVLGICKGIQLINIYFGGGILQDLNPDSLNIHAWQNGDRLHITKAASGTFLSHLYGVRPVVNSAHHQAVGALGEGLYVSQYAPDFVVEALYHKSLPILGVQWHPERLCFSHARFGACDGSILLKYFLSLL